MARGESGFPKDSTGAPGTGPLHGTKSLQNRQIRADDEGSGSSAATAQLAQRRRAEQLVQASDQIARHQVELLGPDRAVAEHREHALVLGARAGGGGYRRADGGLPELLYARERARGREPGGELIEGSGQRAGAGRPTLSLPRGSSRPPAPCPVGPPSAIAPRRPRQARGRRAVRCRRRRPARPPARPCRAIRAGA